MIDLKSDTPEKDRLHTERFDRAKTMGEKLIVEKGSVGTKYEEDEEERGGEGLRKRRRSKERRMRRRRKRWRRDLPPGRRECQKLEEHTNCLANRTNRNGCFL